MPRFFRLSLALALFVGAFLPSLLRAQSAWTLSRIDLPDVISASSIAYGNGRFVAYITRRGSATQVGWSTDGLTWHASRSSGPLGDVAFIAGSFYIAGGSSVYRSDDGDTWHLFYSQPGLVNSVQVGRMASDGRSFALAMTQGNSPRLVLSADRVAFQVDSTPADVSSPYPFFSLGYFNLRYFAKWYGTNREVYSSTADGVIWTLSSDLTKDLSVDTSFAIGNGRLVAVGYSPAVTRITTDGINFSSVALPSTDGNKGALGYAGGRFFFLNGLNSSLDGVTWAPLAAAPSPPPAGLSRTITSIAYGNGRYVAVGYDYNNTDSLGTVITLLSPAAPVVAIAPGDRTVSEGSPTTFTVSVENPDATTTYQWRHDGAAIAGATAPSFALAAVKTSDAGRYTVDVRNALGTTTSHVAFLTVPAPGAPVVTSPAVDLSVLSGQKASLSVVATGTAPLSYQWLHNGTAIPGATASTFSIATTYQSDEGTYAVAVGNSVGTVTAPVGTLNVTAAGRISNLSVLSALTTPTDSFTLGYVVGGPNVKTGLILLFRAVGPSLAPLGVVGPHPDPKFELIGDGVSHGVFDDWGGAPLVAQAFSQTGAFPFVSATSHDAAFMDLVTTRNNSMKISSAAPSGTGVVLAEIYEDTLSPTFTTPVPRLINVSVLKPVGTGFTVGFTLGGGAPSTVLIRAIGPTLGDFGVPGTVADPQLTLFQSGATAALATNDNWGGTPALIAAFSSVGAFALPAASKDAALLTTLPPGGYSVQVSGVNGTTGTALVEVYELP